MPEPTHFRGQKFPPVSIIRPNPYEEWRTVSSLQSSVNDGLFIGRKTPEFTRVMFGLAEEDDDAGRGFLRGKSSSAFRPIRL